MKIDNKRIALGGFLAATAAMLSAVESALPPLPLVPPGCRLGLANVAVMLAARHISPAAAIFVTLIRSALVLPMRGFVAFLMSLIGGLASTLVVIIIFRINCQPFGCIGAGIVGAAVHNLAQVAAYCAIIGKTAWYFLPVLLFFAIFCGALTGSILFTAQKYIK